MELGAWEQFIKDKMWQCLERQTNFEKKLEAKRPVKKLLQKSQYKVMIVQSKMRQIDKTAF